MSWRGFKGGGYSTRLMHYFFDKPTTHEVFGSTAHTSLCEKVARVHYEKWVDEERPHCKHCEEIIKNHPEKVTAKILKQR